MKRCVMCIALVLLVAALVGVTVLVSGIVPVKASGGHWPITAWLLNFASGRSVATHSVGIEPPPLDEEGMEILGAATYESNCAWCHGRPEGRMPPVAAGMTPPPPSLAHVLPQWKAREKFYIVQHGIKFAGMPAWPVRGRGDEIWPLVAMLQRYPELTLPQYRDLIGKSAAEVDHGDAPELVVENCAACHGVAGTGRAGPRVPRLAGQNRDYLAASLTAYARGDRNSGIMQPIAARLTSDDIETLSDWYAARGAESGTEGSQSAETDSVREGRRLAMQGDANDKIPSCVDCHGRDEHSNPDYPILDGQPAAYLQTQLRLFAERVRGGLPQATRMHPIADKLSEAQRRQVAEFFEQRSKPGQQP